MQLEFLFDDPVEEVFEKTEDKTLNQVWKEKLGELVFGDPDKLLVMYGFGAWTYYGNGADIRPGVSFHYMLDEKNEARGGRVEIMLGLTATDDAFAPRCTGEVPREFLEKIDTILEAFGYSRNQAFELLDFHPTLEVPQDIMNSLKSTGELGMMPFGLSEEQRIGWVDAVRRIGETIGTRDFRVDFAYKTGYDPEKGDIYLLSCTPKSKQSAGGDFFPAQTQLSPIEEEVLNAFVSQVSPHDKLAKLAESRDYVSTLLGSAVMSAIDKKFARTSGRGR